jgi:hypothetical protein
METAREKIRAMQAVKDLHHDLIADPEPVEPPIWGHGWEHTDYLFLDGATDDEFLASFSEMETGLIAAWDDMDPEEIRRAVSIAKSGAVRRWLMLHAANDKPEPRREVAPA